MQDCSNSSVLAMGLLQSIDMCSIIIVAELYTK